MAGTPTLGAKCVAEFLGTFLLIFTVGCNVLSSNAVWAGTSIACVLMVAIYALGGISGANFNPAVSVCLGVSKAMGGPGLDWKDVGIYCGVQITAGIVAALGYAALFWDSFNLAPAPGFNALSAGLCEILYTFMLCFVVLNVAVASNNSPNQFYGLAIGFVIVAGAYGAGAVSGGCFNPAVAIGIDVASAGMGFGWCIAYMIFEMIGAVLAAVLFKIVRPEDFGGEKGGAAAELTSEFLGTFILVLTVGLNVLGKSSGGAFSIAASLMCMIYALGNVSGAHFNPAVTTAILASGRCPDLKPAKAAMYVGVQLIGGMVAALTYTVIHNGASFKLGPGPKFGYGEVALAEGVFTFVLCFVVLSVAVSTTTNNGTMFGLAIGACVTVGGNAIGTISGGSLNPAVSFGIAAGHKFADGSLVAACIYTLIELIGAGAAAGVFMVTHAVDKADPKLEKAEAASA